MDKMVDERCSVYQNPSVAAVSVHRGGNDCNDPSGSVLVDIIGLGRHGVHRQGSLVH